MKRIRNRNIFILLTIILSLGITLGAVYFMYQYKDSRENELKTSMISLSFTEKSEVINLSSNVPMIDDLGLKSRPYEFTITNTSTVPIKADIKLDVDNTTTIKYGAVRYALFINNEKVIKDYVHRDNLILYEVDELQPNQVINCKLYFWIDYYYDYPGEIFKAKIKAVGESIDVVYKEATFLGGTVFNAKIKKLASLEGENITYTTNDTNITSIIRVTKLPNNFVLTEANILSTSDSEVPIYGWFDNGILYYYTLAKNPYMNQYANFMFSYLKNVTNIDIVSINTEKTTSMQRMFIGNNNLEQLNLSNFNTKNVYDMSCMFDSNSNLKYLNLVSFDTSNVDNMYEMFFGCSKLNTIVFGQRFITENVSNMFGMFYNCSSLETLDISFFDMSNINSISNMFHGMTLLKKLKTPKVYPNNLSITLPKTLYDSNHNAYTTLESTSPTETWLKSE